MQHLPDFFYEVTTFSVILRLVLAMLYGGIIGLERGSNKHPAGFRTHILVCLGACLAMLTNQYIFSSITPISDPSRMGAQVITGVGFLGVGTILVTGGHKIKGLTTAAGLWASACIGLALGIGFYLGALVAGLLAFISLAVFPKVESHFYNRSRIIDVYIELDSLAKLNQFKVYVKTFGIQIMQTYLGSSDKLASGGIGCHMSFKIPKDVDRTDLINTLSEMDGIYLVEEF